MLKKVDANKVRKMFEKVEVLDMDWEELAGKFSELADEYGEKENEERAEAYGQVSDAIMNFVEAYQELYSTLENYEVIEN